MRYYLILLAFLSGFSAYQAFGYPEVNPEKDNIVKLYGEIDDRSAEQVVMNLYQTAVKSKKSVWLDIYSGGGSVLAGNKIIAAMDWLKDHDVTVNCSVKVAASMALHIFAHCSNRYIQEDSKLLWHSVAVFWIGKLSYEDVKELYEKMKAIEEPLDDYLRSELDLDKEFFDKHRIAETWWTGAELFVVSPRFAKIVEFGDNLEGKLVDVKTE